ncbi:BRCA1-associated ATM activator 1-like isoform X2 [Mizuhopecten yessoensis]|uniref:BRCA1-associated ATM activator 1-like isoform X2 n=1 Tax=Mizuhopecten yessoensis TaxID=6573 RepID=UPI000B45AF66|nr:BRCA1-associated ATM activator 1-like isoform X2 [Mizuhopecten yessoensis]
MKTHSLYTVKSSKQAEQCGVGRFLASILNQKDVEISVLVFSINLAGVLGQIPDLNNQQGEIVETFMDFVLKEKDLNNPSIGTGYFDTLRKLIKFRTAKCLYVHKIEKELVLKCWQLLTDARSLFLTSAVLRFLKDYFGLCEDVQYVEECSYTTIVQSVVNHICQAHKTTNDADSRPLPSILPSVLQLLQDIPRLLIETLDRTVIRNLSECLAYIVCNMGKDTYFCALEALLSLQIKVDVQEQREIESIVKQLSQDLVEKDILRSQKICIKMLESRIHEGLVKDLLLCPLYVITGRTHLVQTTELHSRQITTHMDSKSTCVQIILNSLEIFRFTDVPQDAVEATVELFDLTHDSSTGQIPFTRFLLHNKRVQQSCLDLFIKHQNRWGCTRKLCCSVLDIVKTEALDNVTFSKCLDALFKLAPEVLLSTDLVNEDGETIGQRLINTVQHSLCCIDWERRDTTLEFLTKLLSSCPDHSGVTEWIRSGRLCVYVYQALDDANSYMRATALTCLQRVLESSQLTTDLLQQCDITLDDVFRKVLKILESDTEAFARRESVSFITRMWNSVHGDLKADILQVLVERASSDFDWEVKVKLVDFWEMLMEKDLLRSEVQLPSYADGLLQREKQQNLDQAFQEFIKTACFESLFKLLDDYDQSVCQKACLLLIRVMKHMSGVLERHDSLPPDSDIPVKKRKTNDSDIESIYQKLKALDLTARLLEVSTTCDEYDKNPMSLLEDMLTYSNKTDPEDESNVIDCY